MKKIAYVLDSSSCLSSEAVNNLGYMFLPLHVIIEGEDYLEGSTLDMNYLYEAIKGKKSVSTSQPSPGEITQLIEDLKSNGYDEAVFVGLSSGLSKTQETVRNIAHSENYPIHIVDTMGIGDANTIALEKVKKLIEEGKEGRVK